MVKPTEAIKREPSLEKVPILMNSSCSKEMFEAALLAGCDDAFSGHMPVC